MHSQAVHPFRVEMSRNTWTCLLYQFYLSRVKAENRVYIYIMHLFQVNNISIFNNSIFKSSRQAQKLCGDYSDCYNVPRGPSSERKPSPATTGTEREGGGVDTTLGGRGGAGSQWKKECIGLSEDRLRPSNRREATSHRRHFHWSRFG